MILQLLMRRKVEPGPRWKKIAIVVRCILLYVTDQVVSTDQTNPSGDDEPGKLGSGKNHNSTSRPLSLLGADSLDMVRTRSCLLVNTPFGLVMPSLSDQESVRHQPRHQTVCFQNRYERCNAPYLK